MSNTTFRLGGFLCGSPTSQLFSFLVCGSLSSQTLAPPCQPHRAFFSGSCLATTGAGDFAFPAMGDKLERRGGVSNTEAVELGDGGGNRAAHALG